MTNIRDIRGAPSPGVRTDNSNTQVTQKNRVDSGNKATNEPIPQESLQLPELKATIDEKSTVNQQRVEALKAAIDKGEYQVDSEKLASQLLDQENDLFG